MKVRVIDGKCAGHGRCAATAPEVYILNDDGYMDTVEIEPPVELETAARRGARSCPERAIEIVEDAEPAAS